MGSIKLKIKVSRVTIDTEFIRLDSFLKLCGAVGTGGQAKFEIQSGTVEVDGKICTLRGKKLRHGQKVRFDGKNYELISTLPSSDQPDSSSKEKPASPAKTPFSKNLQGRSSL